VGTLNLGGVPALPEAYTVGAGWGLDLSAHRTRALSPGAVAAADLVLGFEQMHVRQAVVDGSAASACTFTLGELVRLLGELSEPVGGPTLVERARLRVAAAHAARGGAAGRLDAADELSDPFGRRRSAYRATGDALARLAFALVARLFEVERAATFPGSKRPDDG